MSIRESRLRSRARLRKLLSASGPVPHSSRARRQNKLSVRRRRRARVEDRSEEKAVVQVTASPCEAGGLAPQVLSELTGLTPAMEKQLHAMGQTRFFQLAHWSAEMIAKVAAQLGLEAAQIRAANWISQARRRG